MIHGIHYSITKLQNKIDVISGNNSNTEVITLWKTTPPFCNIGWNEHGYYYFYRGDYGVMSMYLYNVYIVPTHFINQVDLHNDSIIVKYMYTKFLPSSPCRFVAADASGVVPISD